MKHSVKPVRLSLAVLACLICVITATICNSHLSRAATDALDCFISCHVTPVNTHQRQNPNAALCAFLCRSVTNRPASRDFLLSRLPLLAPHPFTPDFCFHRLSGTVAVGSASATHKPLQRPCLRAVWMLCDSACGHISGFLFFFLPAALAGL